MNFKLHDYQTKMVEEIRECYRQKDQSVLLQLATGGGKTFTFCYIGGKAAALGNIVWVLVHRSELVRQSSESLRTLGVEHGIIAPGFTPDPFAKVQVASVQTLVRRLGKLIAPNLIIVDECHHSVAASWDKVLRFYPKAKILGVTATPVRLDGRGLGRDFGGHYDSMVNGPPLSELITRGFLSPPHIYAPPVGADLSNLHKRYGEFVQAEAAELMDKPKITGCAVEHYSRISPNIPAIGFCVSVAHAEHVAEEFRAKGFNAASIDGSMDDRERKKRIQDLGNGKLHVLTSCDVISEGTDIPIVGTAILLRPSASFSMVMQQVGRALRVFPGKTHANVIDHVNNMKRHDLEGLGLPEWDVEWSLTGEIKRKKKASESSVGFKTCPACYRAHPPAPKCPYCGEVYEAKSGEPEQVEGRLERVDPAVRARLEQIEKDRAMFDRMKEEKQCRSIEDWEALAEKRGHKKSWAQIRYNIAQQRKNNMGGARLPGV